MVEGSARLFQIIVNNPIKLLTRGASLLFTHTIVGFQRLGEIVLKGIFFVITNLYVGSKQILFITYNIVLEMPLRGLSKTTTVIAQTIAQQIKTIHALNNSIFKPLLRFVKNTTAALINFPAAVMTKIKHGTMLLFSYTKILTTWSFSTFFSVGSFLEALVANVWATCSKTILGILNGAKSFVRSSISLAVYSFRSITIKANKSLLVVSQFIVKALRSCSSACSEILKQLFNLLKIATSTLINIPITFGKSLVSVGSQIYTGFANAGKSIVNMTISASINGVSNAFGSFKNKSIQLKESQFIQKNRERLNFVNAATRTALSGTAGFVFFSVPRSTIFAIKMVINSIKNGVLAFFSWIVAFTKEVIQLWFIDTPQELLKYTYIAYKTTTHKVASLFRMLFVKTITQQSSEVKNTESPDAEAINQNPHTLSKTQTYSFILVNLYKQTMFKTADMITSVATLTKIFCYKSAINTVQKTYQTIQKILSFSQNAFKKFIHGAITVARYGKTNWLRLLSNLKSKLRSTKKILQYGAVKTIHIIKKVSSIIVRFVTNSIARMSKGFINTSKHILFFLRQFTQEAWRYLKGSILTTASAGKKGFILVKKSSTYGIEQIKPVTIGFINATYTFLIMVSKIARWLADSAITAGKNNKLTIQKYAITGTLLYSIIVLLTTYITPPKSTDDIHQFKYINSAEFSHSLPINTSFELQNISYEKGTFGTVSIKGILSYSYEAGLESARNIDNITVEKAEKFSLKKLGSNMNHKHIVTTRFLLTATLDISAPKSPAFPFAPTESMFIIKNKALSNNEMVYIPTSNSFGTEFNGADKIKIRFKQAAKSPALSKNPKISIVLEHTGVPTYRLFTLYSVILFLTFMALTSLGGALPQTVRLAVSAVGTAGLTITWIGSLILGLLPTINHLLLTLLMCFAVSLLCVGFNAQYVAQKETRPEAGKTRWLLGLLTLLAVFFTLLIGL